MCQVLGVPFTCISNLHNSATELVFIHLCTLKERMISEMLGPAQVNHTEHVGETGLNSGSV